MHGRNPSASQDGRRCRLISNRFNVWIGRLKGRFQELNGKEHDEGQAMVEYALILGLVSLVAVTVLGFIGADANSIFQKIDDALKTAL
jgi:Flp pilus assembly pilin Flp